MCISFLFELTTSKPSYHVLHPKNWGYRSKNFELGPSEAEKFTDFNMPNAHIYGVCPYMVITLGLDNFL